MEEIWKEISYDSRYRVSNLGRVSGIKSPILTPEITYNGYLRIAIQKKHYLIHRLVLETFNPVENMDKLQVNHIDGNKENNCLNNLEWVTPSENKKHAIYTLNKVPSIKAMIDACSYNVKVIMQNGEELFFESQRKCAEALGIPKSNISYNLARKGYYEKNGIKIIDIHEIKS